MNINDLKFKTGEVEVDAFARLLTAVPELPISQNDAEIILTSLQVYLEAKALDAIACLSYEDSKAAYKRYNEVKQCLFMRQDLPWLVEALHYQVVTHGYQSTTFLGILKIRLTEWWECSVMPKLTKFVVMQRKANWVSTL